MGEINIPLISGTAFGGKANDQKIVLKNIENFYNKSAKKISRIDGLSMDFKSSYQSARWRFNVRPSNTESYLRINIEAADTKTLRKKKNQIIGIIKRSDK
ncbi:MAG: hypothetical protein M1334_01935 [Patescibacteria group bacterium]|nr:hypothetical protein [Patescibacteria group bacterium]